MRIGLTYDLREEYLAKGWSEQQVAEFDRADTIDALEGALRTLGHDPVRIGGASALMERLGAGDSWDLVLNIAEGQRGNGRESLIPAMLDHAGVPYTFGDPLCCALSLDKPSAKHVLRSHDLPTPDFAVVENAADADRVAIGFPVFAKPSREGSSKGVTESSVCRDRAQLRSVCARLIEQFEQPVLVESFLPGREVTVGIIGSGPRARAIGVLAVGVKNDAAVYAYDDKERCEDLIEYTLDDSPFAGEAGRLALSAYRAMGCRDAGRVDLRADDTGAPQIIEVNALAGLHPSHSDLPIMATLAGVSYVDLIGRIIESAGRRIAAGATADQHCCGCGRCDR